MYHLSLCNKCSWNIYKQINIRCFSLLIQLNISSSIVIFYIASVILLMFASLRERSSLGSVSKELCSCRVALSSTNITGRLQFLHIRTRFVHLKLHFLQVESNINNYNSYGFKRIFLQFRHLIPTG